MTFSCGSSHDTFIRELQGAPWPTQAASEAPSSWRTAREGILVRMSPGRMLEMV